MIKHAFVFASALSFSVMLHASQTPPPSPERPQTPATQTAKQGELSDVDRTFAQKAAAAGKAEIAMAKLAQQKSSNDRVKAYAKQLEQDHLKADAELQKIVGSALKPDPQLEAKSQEHLEHLKQMSGAEFDRSYIMQMVDDHKMVSSEFEKYSSSGSHAGLKNFAQKTLPTLKQHLQQAEQLQRQFATSSARR